MEKTKLNPIYIVSLVVFIIVLTVVLVGDSVPTPKSSLTSNTGDLNTSVNLIPSTTQTTTTEATNDINETITSDSSSGSLSTTEEESQETNQTSSYTTTSTITTSESSIKIQDLGAILEERTETVDNSKEELVEIINESVTDITESDEALEQNIDTTQIDILYNELLENVDSSLSTPSTITPVEINNLKTDITKSIEDINKISTENTITTRASEKSLEDIATTLDLLSEAISNQSEPLKQQEAELLYKDSNQDGVSDYDSLYIYNLDPVLPSPISIYEGKIINAQEKILLGFNPVEVEIVKVEKEQPVKSSALTVLTYKVKEVVLTEKKEILFKGQALPNSFITLYIYSTPIIVTIKTDERGEWQYTLDKELENGDHTIYTATVNNSGNIIAKSSPFPFIKTAESATLTDISNFEPATNVDKPGLLQGNNLYIMLAVVLVAGVVVLILAGMTKKNKEEVNS